MSSFANLNLNLKALSTQGHLKEAIHLLLTTRNPPVDTSTYFHLLQVCIAKKALSEGKQIHSHINDRGHTFATNTFLQNTVINMYDKCGSLLDARQAFDHMVQRDVFSWNMIMAGYKRHGLAQEAFALFHQMQRTIVQSNEFTFSTILPLCANAAYLKHGLQIHGKIIRCRFQSHDTVMNILIGMYAKCISIQKARELFDKMHNADVVSWTTMITAYAQNGILDEALSLFKEMPERNVVSWTAVIVGYAQNGLVEKIVEIFKQMQLEGVKPDSSTFASILQACGILGALEEGMEIHQKIVESGLLSHVVVMTALIDMYAKCGSIEKASELFDKMPQPNVVSATAIIAGCAQNGFVEKALEIFNQIQLAGIMANSATYASILPACAKTGAFKQGKEIHSKIFKSGFFSDDVVLTALIDMYAKCGNIQNAYKLFDKMPQRDVVSWTAIIAGYAQNGIFEKALENFQQMQSAGVKPNSSTFASILPACAKIGTLHHGMEIHQKMIESGLLSHVVVMTALIDMYAKCGNIQKARILFDKMHNPNVVSQNAIITAYAQIGVLDEALTLFKEMPQRNVFSWNAMIVGYAQNGLVEKALDMFKQMQLGGVKSDSSTFATILPACAKLGALHHGMEIHQKIIESEFSSVVVMTALIYMYAKCGSIWKAHKLFDKMPQRDVFSWTAIIAGYAQNGLVEKSLENFQQMQLAGIKPDSSTFASILPACAKIGALEQGMEIHQKIIESGFLSDFVNVTALIDMYAKCGSIKKASALFGKMHHPDVASWNAMIAGYAIHGHGEDALKLFELMKHTGTISDHISFVCVLFACSHAGLVDAGCKYFNHMSDSYCIMPTMDHYACMVDLLGRANYLEESLNFIIKMPIKPDAVVWMCLLGACRSNKNVGLGEIVARLLFELDPRIAAPYVLMSNIYAEAGRWGDVQNLRKLLKDRGIKKIAGCSWIEVHKKVHAFSVADRSHPQTQEIYAMLDKLSQEMKSAGYIPDIKFVLNDVKEEKEILLCHDDEKLEAAFGC